MDKGAADWCKSFPISTPGWRSSLALREYRLPSTSGFSSFFWMRLGFRFYRTGVNVMARGVGAEVGSIRIVPSPLPDPVCARL
ncbi:hypothetical protein AMATHDRAFT_67545, partial [Amanita thiersii Skay4041]